MKKVTISKMAKLKTGPKKTSIESGFIKHSETVNHGKLSFRKNEVRCQKEKK